jgi:hypothetical protein
MVLVGVLVFVLLQGTARGLAAVPRTDQQLPVIFPPCTGFPDMCPRPVFYRPGWNLIAGTTGDITTARTIIVGTDAPLYTLQAGDTSYESIPSSTPLEPGIGYWAHFPLARSEVLPPVYRPQPTTKSVPAGQWVMIGNPFAITADVSGADAVYSYSALLGSTGYQSTTQLEAGQGGWAYSAAGGAITFTPTPLRP